MNSQNWCVVLPELYKSKKTVKKHTLYKEWLSRTLGVKINKLYAVLHTRCVTKDTEIRSA